MNELIQDLKRYRLSLNLTDISTKLAIEEKYGLVGSVPIDVMEYLVEKAQELDVQKETVN